jgi:hypothetical protein
MFFKNLYNKLSRILLSVLILNLIFWNLLLVPAQTQAINTLGNYSCDPDIDGMCHSCNSEGVCVRDDNGPYTCPKCNEQCSSPTTSEIPGTPSGGCGSAPITGTMDVYIVGSVEQSAAEAATQEGINTLEDLANATGLVDEAKQSLIDLINQNKPIPEDLKEFMISAITNDADISSNNKNALINLINQDKPIPEYFKGIMTTMIENLKNTVGLVKNKFLDLILAGLDIEAICLGLANAVTGLPWGAGAAISAAIEFACPPLLDAFLTELGFYEEKIKTGESIQIIPVPTLEYYEWEVGIPGFIKPGQSTKFK